MKDLTYPIRSLPFHFHYACCFLISVLISGSNVFAATRLPVLPVESNDSDIAISTSPFDLSKIRPKTPKKLPGVFESPRNELIKTNFPNAKVSCIQEALNNGTNLPSPTPRNVWEFASRTTSKSAVTAKLEAMRITALKKNLATPNSGPRAFRFSACQDDIRRSSCAALLTKSMTSNVQASYRSEIETNKSIWDEVNEFLGFQDPAGSSNDHPDIVSAIRERNRGLLGDGQDPAINNSDGLESTDAILFATNLLVQRIDEALAHGDRETSEKARVLLQKVNPSAAHALGCVLGYLADKGLNENLDPSGKPLGDVIGPLSGVNYSKLNDMGTHGEAPFPEGLGGGSMIGGTVGGGGGGPSIWTRIGAAMASNKVAAAGAAIVGGSSVASSISTHYFSAESSITSKKAAYDACRLGNGGRHCDLTWPDEALALKNAIAKDNADKRNADEASGTDGVRPFEGDGESFQIDPPVHKPSKGEGGAGGELVPDDPTLDLTFKLKQQAKEQNSWIATIDESAKDNYCQSVISSYNAWTASSTNSPSVFDPETLIDSVRLPVSLDSFTSTHFDDWDVNFWREKRKEFEKNSQFQSVSKSCNSMDRVQQ